MTQEERCTEARAHFLQAHKRVRLRLLDYGPCPAELWTRYEFARAAFLVAQGASEEEFSKYVA